MKKDKILKIIFIIIIIILLLLLIKQYTGKKQMLNKTGNVDIFEINCDGKNNCETNIKVNKDNNDSTDINTKVKGSNITNDNEDIIVSDNDIIWKQTNKLNIFENPMYDIAKKIAPTATNTYEFKIKNNVDFRITYNIDFNENNKYGIDMRYRLKKENEYVTGDEWVKYNDLNLTDIELNSNEEDTYYLEWKWFEGTNDTYAGEQGGVGYTLSINLDAYGKN